MLLAAFHIAMDGGEYELADQHARESIEYDGVDVEDALAAAEACTRCLSLHAPALTSRRCWPRPEPAPRWRDPG